jgi:hypothetical protein
MEPLDVAVALREMIGRRRRKVSRSSIHGSSLLSKAENPDFLLGQAAAHLFQKGDTTRGSWAMTQKIGRPLLSPLCKVNYKGCSG